MGSTNIIYGPPGTGKTTTLLDLVEEYLSKGVKPHEIAYLSFTVKAANEAKFRAMERFNYQEEEVPWFRTLHSFAFRILRLSTGDIMKREHYSELCEKLGIEYSGYIQLDEGAQLSGALMGDRMLFNEGLHRVRLISPEEQYHLTSEDYSIWEFKRFVEALEKFKGQYALLDFNDMISLTLKEKLPTFKVLFVDEAQDLSRLQWELVNRLIDNSEVSYVAGDDDQAIFRWAGADPESFLGCRGDASQLTQSYRLPSAVHARASGIIGHCSTGRRKRFEPASHPGSVRYLAGPDELPLDAQDSGSWLILARNAYLLNPYQEVCEINGYAYDSKKSHLRTDAVKAIKAYEDFRRGNGITDDGIKVVKKYYPGFDPARVGPIWHEAFSRLGREVRDYFIAALRRGESLTKAPRIKLSTIHGSKGGEADNVVVISDMSFKSYEEYLSNPDDEIRVFYVAVTRAKKNLYIIEPQSSNSFEFL